MAVLLPFSLAFGAPLLRSVLQHALHIGASLPRALLLSSNLVALVPFLPPRLGATQFRFFFSSSSSLTLFVRAKLRIMCLSTVLASSPVLCGGSILRRCTAFAAAQWCNNTLAACLAGCPTCALAVSCSSWFQRRHYLSPCLRNLPRICFLQLETSLPSKLVSRLSSSMRYGLPAMMRPSCRFVCSTSPPCPPAPLVMAYRSCTWSGSASALLLPVFPSPAVLRFLPPREEPPA